jgi:cysteine-rich repeat protein
MLQAWENSVMTRRLTAAAFAAAFALALLLLGGAASAGPPNVCGDGIEQPPEGCDDGNTVGGDGCSANCVPEICGDGIVEPATEQCDDENTAAGDGCDASCQFECGNGMLDPGEACDDGNQMNGDGCDDDVANQGNCTNTACGNGVLTPPEECDDGNTMSGDGCEADCTLPTAPQSRVQQACINEVNKRATQIARAVNKEATRCLKDTAKGKIDDFDACLLADGRGKIAKAQEKAASGQARRCNQAELPDFAFLNDIATVQQVSEDEPLGLIGDVFGVPADPAIAEKVDKVGSRCQAEVQKGAAKLYETLAKEFDKAKKQALKGTKNVTAVAGPSELEIVLQGTPSVSKKVAKATQALNTKPVKKCEGGAPDGLFPGVCASPQLGEVLTCVTQRTTCRSCTAYNAIDDIAIDCDVLDNGASDGSCP